MYQGHSWNQPGCLAEWRVWWSKEDGSGPGQSGHKSIFHIAKHAWHSIHRATGDFEWMLCWHSTIGLWPECQAWLLLVWKQFITNFEKLIFKIACRHELATKIFPTWPLWRFTSRTSSIETLIPTGNRSAFDLWALVIGLCSLSLWDMWMGSQKAWYVSP